MKYTEEKMKEVARKHEAVRKRKEAEEVQKEQKAVKRAEDWGAKEMTLPVELHKVISDVFDETKKVFEVSDEWVAENIEKKTRKMSELMMLVIYECIERYRIKVAYVAEYFKRKRVSIQCSHMNAQKWLVASRAAQLKRLQLESELVKRDAELKAALEGMPYVRIPAQKVTIGKKLPIAVMKYRCRIGEIDCGFAWCKVERLEAESYPELTEKEAMALIEKEGLVEVPRHMFGGEDDEKLYDTEDFDFLMANKDYFRRISHVERFYPPKRG